MVVVADPVVVVADPVVVAAPAVVAAPVVVPAEVVTPAVEEDAEKNDLDKYFAPINQLNLSKSQQRMQCGKVFCKRKRHLRQM